jgi:hypothetical protein
MAFWRPFFLKHQRLAYLLAAMALLAKAIVPQGFMVMPSNSTIMVLLCSGQGSKIVAMDLGKGTVDHGSDHQDSRKADHPCSFSGLSMAAAPGPDLLLLGLALAYVLTLGFHPIVSPQQRGLSRLRPPLRGPPALG